MGERSLESGDDVVVEFARDLRLLREKAESLTYRALSKRAHYSAAALSEAASGRKLPSLSVTLAYVAGCGGDTVEWEARWRTIAAELAAAKPNGANSADDENLAPYVGLAAFQQEDADRFFGRDKPTAELMARLRQGRFLGVFGASGCGKSSLLRAGLAAALAADPQHDSAVVVFTPGRHPVEECAVHLARFLGESPGTLRDEIRADPRNLHLRIRQVAAGTDVVLVVDQFEELFTLCGDERERAGFVEALVIAATDPASRARVVLGVRADFLGHCGRYPELVSALRDAQVLVGAMSTDELRLAVTRPAEQAGYRVETALVARLVADATRQPGVLPLVSHALLQTWRRRQGTLVTAAGYDAVGGIENALARTADEVYQALDPGQRIVAKQIILRLTALGEGTEDTKRRIARDELDHDDPTTALVLDTLTQARLVTVGHDSVEIAHEALIRHWPRLRDWLAEDREGHRLHRHLTDAATEWAHHQRDEGLLYRGARLAAWQDRPLDRLNDTERAFLTGSRRAEERERRSRRRRVRWAVGGLATATAVVTVLAVVALGMAARADDERTLAVGRQLAADARAQLPVDPELALLLAREAYQRTPNEDTEAVVRQATADSHLRATLHGPPEPMLGVAFHPDGKRLATSSSTERRVWDWAAGRVTQTQSPVLNYHARASVFSQDGFRVAETDGYRKVRVWDWAHPDKPVTMPGQTSEAVHLAFSPDGQRVAGGTRGSGNVLVWDVRGDSEPRVLPGRAGVLPGRAGVVAAVAFGPDGNRLATAASDGAVRVWDIARGTNLTLQQPNNDDKPEAVAFSPDGNHVVTAHTDGAVRVWDTTGAAGPVVLGSHAGAATGLAYSPDGRSIASTGVDGTVRIWNATHPAAPVVLRGHRGTVTAAAFSPDGKFVASVGTDGTARIWIVDEIRDQTVLGNHQGPVRSIAASPDGRRLASGGQDGTVRIWDTTGKRAPTVLAGNGLPVRQVTFSQDGNHLAAVHEVEEQLDSVRVWRIQDLTVPTGELLGGPVAFNPDGNKLAVGGVLGFVAIYPANGTRLTEPEVLSTSELRDFDHDLLFPVAWSPDGEHIASVDSDVRLSDLHRPGKPVVLPGPPGQLRALAFSPDSTHLASAGEDGAVHLWNTASTANPTVLTGHQGPVTSVAFSADGRHLITSGEDATVRIWPTRGTNQPLVLDGFRASVQAVVPLPDGRYATAHDDGTVRTWRCPACGPVDEVLEQADQHVTRELTPQERETYLATVR